MPRRRSLRRKLVSLVFASVGASLAIATAVALWQQATNYGEMRRQALVATAEIFAAAAGPATAAGNGDDAFLALRAIDRVPGIRYAEILAPDGRPLAASGKTARLSSDVAIEGEDAVSLPALLRSGTVQVTVPVLHGGVAVGRLTVIGGISDLWPRLLDTLTFTLVGGAGALLAGLLVAWRLQRSITAPLASLLRAMAAIRRNHDYDVAVANAPDREIGELVDGFNHMLRDVRERDERLAAHRRNLEAEVADRTRDLRQARDAAQAANRAKSEFLATMSHEIRTPMNGIMVMAEMLAGEDLPRRQRRYAETIARSGRSLLAVINDVLDFSKIESGRLELERVPVDLAELADNVSSLFSERARRAGIDLAAFVDPALPRSVLGDPVRLGQVVTNLVNNALKFTEHGSVSVEIGFAAGDRRRIEIRVDDSGIGIPQDKLATIFEAFSQADQTTTRRFGGTGLGLAICKRLVEAMDGEIRVASRPGAGSSFSFAIPCEALAAASWPRSNPPAPAICVLDLPQRATRAALARYLAAAGYEVHGEAPERRPQARLICAAAERIAAPGFERAGPIVVAVGDPAGHPPDLLIASGAADAVLGSPLLRSEIEELLARIAAGAAVLAPLEARPRRNAPVAGFHPFKALVADDNAVNREVAAAALGKLGATVAAVASGAEAVAALAGSQFDIVFMDGSMPEMDGFTATRRIRAVQARSRRARTPIVGLTAHVLGVRAEEWRECGMDAVVHKPFTIADLARTVGELLPHLPRAPTAAPGAAAPDPERPQPIAAGAAGATGRDDRPPLLDREILEQLETMRAAGGGSLARRVFDLYLEHAPAMIARLDEAAGSGDREGCARAAHALKSMSYNAGALRMAEQARRLERWAESGAQAPPDGRLDDLSATMRETIGAMRAMLAHGRAVAAAPAPAAS